MGRHAARNVLAALAGKTRLWGWLAWITWLTTHVFFLIGFRNRLEVIIDWAWVY